MLTSVILIAGTLYAPAGEGAQASSAATKTLAITSRGAKTGYQMQFLRLHAGEGTDSVSGSNDTTQHLYLGANSDPDFFGVRFYEADGSTPIVHRRMFCVPGQYADFILKLDLPAAGQTKQVVVNYAACGRTTESSDAALENIHFYGWVRRGASCNGLLRDQWGVEMTTLAEKGKVRAWFRGSAGGGRGDYAGQGRMRYGESADGVTWADLGEATGLGPYEGQPYVYQDENGLYHMMYNDGGADGGVWDYRYLTSPSGSNGTWSIVSESAFRPDGGPGNLCFWKEGGTWHLLYEWMQNEKWVTSYAQGPALDRLTKYNNGSPVLSGAGMVGGIEVHKVGPTYYVFGHAGEGSGNLPTSAVLYKSTDLTTLSRVGWAMRRYYHATYAAQVADPTVKEFNGKTFLWYESQPDQHDANVPYLSAATWDQPLARMLDPVVTTAVQDDLEAEGWVFDAGCGENNTHTLGTVFRKLSDKPSPISPNCVVVRTEPGRFLKIRKAIGPLAAENVFEFYARAEQTNKRFECFRIDKDGANGILAGVYFDADGSIKYYQGQSSVTAQSYSAGAYYRFQVIQKTGGYDLKIGGKLIAKDIPYPASFSMPTHFYVGQDSGATGYISGLYTRLYSDPDTEPVWGWNRDEPAIPGTATNSPSGTVRADELEQLFDHPPAAAKPRAMWVWMGCHLSQAGITRDLEALHEAGFGGTLMFHLTDAPTTWSADIGKSPTPEIITWTEPWWKLVRHAAVESQRLGLDFGMGNCAGYGTSGGPWIPPELSMQQICWSETPANGPGRISMDIARPQVDPRAINPWPVFNSDLGKEEKPVIPARKTFYRDIAVLALPATGTVARAQVIDLSDKVGSDGRLDWEAPAGQWIIYRFGHTTMGTLQFPAQWKINGLECDKMNPEAVALHMNHVIGEIKKHLGDLPGKGLKFLHFDSYEAGPAKWTPDWPYWTPKMSAEFSKRRGYELTAFLPTLAKRTIGGDEETKRFRADFEATIQDLYRDSYFATLSRILRQAGLDYSSEPYEGPWKVPEVTPHVHRVVAEFWSDSGNYRDFWTAATIAAARQCGRNIIEAEAFTSMPEHSLWNEYPGMLKAVGDVAFCEGINRFILHRFTHQPWDERYRPGFAMGQWGTHFDRTQTWWEPGKAMFRYWQRCQALLQWGQYVGEPDAFKVVPSDGVEFGVAVACSSSQPSFPVANVRDNNLETFWVSNGFQPGQGPTAEKPEWVSWEHESPRTVGSLALSPRPGYGPKDCQFQYSEDGQSWITLKAITAGSEPMKVEFEPVQARFFRLVVTSSHVSENTQIRELTLLRPGEKPPLHQLRLRFIQRRSESTDVFFVANTNRSAGGRVTGSFAVSGKQPELWDPVTGTRRDLPEFEQREGRTLIPLEFAPAQSWFVVFRKPSAETSSRKRSGALTRNFSEVVQVAEIGGSWQVSFDPQWGGPAEPVTFAKLEDWTKRPEPGIRYYSGTAVYRTGFDVPPSTLRPPESRMFLDLGKVNHVARVRLNGRDLGVVWTAPWRVDISDAAREQANRLEIEIANVWANRLIGDEQEPADCAWYPVSPANGWCLGTPLKELPDWLLKGESRPSTGRYCFTTWKYATGAMSLVPSGLLGPVRVMTAEKVEHSSSPTRIVCPTDGSAMEILAAREVRRYWYLRTGDLLPIVPSLEQPSPVGGGFVVGRKDRAALRNIGGNGAWNTTLAGLGPQQYLLRTIEQGGNRWLLIVGGDDVGTLYGAYRVAEHAGVRFYLHGDVVPDERLRAELPNLDEQGKPLFALRGINPFHDFPFGPDWWTTEDYKAIIAQLAKMRMNFIGFHCYAENSSHPAEPTVWTGLKGEFDDQGRVLVGYPSRLNHTMESPIPVGGFSVPMKTSDYRFGAAMLFDRDDAGSEAVAVASAQSDPVESQKAMFNHCGTMFREAFGLARVLGVKTCVGTEVPNRGQTHVMPASVVERLRAQGKDPADPAVVREVYEAMFQRIKKTHPLDYYWLWTPEGWVRHFDGASAEELKVALQHFNAAHEAIQRVGAPFRLATAGWELGPQEDRAAYDRLLPKDVAVSSINPELGFDPVEPAFARIQGRDKWAIPWLEDDVVLMNPQLWVGRIRKDAAEALAYGCTGLLGIHWRTQIMAPNLAALAEAGWSQTPWNPEPGKVPADGMGPRYEDSVDAARRPQPPLTLRLIDWPKVATPRGLRTTDFYADWAQANFGHEAASEVAALFEQIDGNLPRPLRGCPSGLNPDNRPWNQVVREYGFVDDLQECRKKMHGSGNLARFDYWLNWLRYLRATAYFECSLGQYLQAMAKVQAEQDPARRKELAKTLGLPAYREVFQRYVAASDLLLQMAKTTEDLATVAVWQQTYYPLPLNEPVPLGATSTRTSALLGATLTSALGEPLPADVQPTQRYQGPPRLIVPTIRSTAVEGDTLPLRIIVLDQQPPRSVKLHWRTMGTGEYAEVDFQHVARGVHTVNLPPISSAGLEYYVKVTTGDGQQLVFPPTAPQLNQTIVALPPSPRSSQLTSDPK